MDQKEVSQKVYKEMVRLGVVSPAFEKEILFYLDLCFGCGYDKGLYFHLNRKPIAQYNDKGEKIREFSSAKEASDKTGFDYSNIGKAAKGNRSKAGGFYWKYIT